MSKAHIKSAFIVAVPSILIFLFSKDFILFWDTIQFAGHHPLFYFESGFSEFFLPTDLDSGHIPTFGIYVALVWSIIGKSLWASHLAIMPFVMLCFYNAYRLGIRWTSDGFAWVFPFVLLCIPQSIGHMILVSPDIVLLAAFLGLIHSLDTHRNGEAMTWATLLPIISNRGAILLVVVILWRLALSGLISRDSIKRRIINLYHSFSFALPGLLLFSVYQILHFIHMGWVGYGEEMSWSSSFRFVDFSGFLKNVAVLGWRLGDYGMITMWLLFIYFIGKERSRIREPHTILLILLVAVLGAITIPFGGLMQHRYFLPIIVLVSFLVLKWTFEMDSYRRLLILALVLSLIIGNRVIYLDKIAQGWDSTLAHLPYYSLQSEAIDFIESENISFQNVGTAFPLRSQFSTLYLNDDQRQFQNKDEEQTDYILYSNVMNDFSNEEIDDFKQNWEEVKIWQLYGIKMVLYRR